MNNRTFYKAREEASHLLGPRLGAAEREIQRSGPGGAGAGRGGGGPEIVSEEEYSKQDNDAEEEDVVRRGVLGCHGRIAKEKEEWSVDEEEVGKR